MLKKNLFMTWVQGIVWFVNEDCNIHAETSKIPVLHGNSNFQTFLQGYQPRKELSDEEIHSIVRYLRTLI